MSDEEELMKRRMQQRMQEHLQEQIAMQSQQQQLEATIKIVTSRILDEKARERLSNLRVVKPELAMQLSMYLAQLYQSGQLKSKITDDQLVIILKKLTERKETRIKRR